MDFFGGVGGGVFVYLFSFLAIFYLWTLFFVSFFDFFCETDSKQPKIHRKIHTSLWTLKISRKKSANQKSLDCCQMFVISKRKSYPRVWI
jgi:hypothetical protein